MAGFTPDEGETLVARVLHLRTHADRDADFTIRQLSLSTPK